MLKQEFKNELKEKFVKLFGDAEQSNEQPITVRVTIILDGYKPMSKHFRIKDGVDYFKLLEELEKDATEVMFTIASEKKESDESIYSKGIALDLHSAGYMVKKDDDVTIMITPNPKKRLKTINKIGDILYFIESISTSNPFFKLYEPKAFKERAAIVYKKLNTNCRVEICSIVADEDGLYTSIPITKLMKFGVSVLHKSKPNHPKMATFYLNNENLYVDIVDIDNGMYEHFNGRRFADWDQTDWDMLARISSSSR